MVIQERMVGRLKFYTCMFEWAVETVDLVRDFPVSLKYRNSLFCAAHITIKQLALLGELTDHLPHQQNMGLGFPKNTLYRWNGCDVCSVECMYTVGPMVLLF